MYNLQSCYKHDAKLMMILNISWASQKIYIKISFSSFKFSTFFSFLKIIEMKTLILFANQNIIFSSFFITQKSLFSFNSFLYPDDTALFFISIFTKNLSAFDGIFCLCEVRFCDHICAIIMFQFSHHRNIVNHFDYCWFLNKFEWNFSYCWLECLVLY